MNFASFLHLPVSYFTALTQATVAIARLPKKTKPPITCRITEGVMFFMKKSFMLFWRFKNSKIILHATKK